MIHLSPMTEDEYAAFLEVSVKDYADDKVRAGNLEPEQAEERALQEFARHLPDGLETEDQFLYSIKDAGSQSNLGFAWLGLREEGGRRLAFLYNILIYEAYRRRGYGRQALAALEGRVREMGYDELWLHVFGHNHAARMLYETSGYEITNINMLKRLGS
jgi:ribosomal protein S18 acetylase RimI-like enzyme